MQQPLRFNAGVVPGHKDRMFVFGMSGGGAQSTVMGSSGDSKLYTPYLKLLGAAMTDARGNTISDAIAGVMAWCPITSLDYANASYEWNMGQFASTGTRAAGTWTKAYSNDLADAFAAYQNSLGLEDFTGKTLTLANTSAGTFLSSSYHDHLVSVVENSLNAFLKVTTFPYTPSTGRIDGAPPAGGAAPAGGLPSGVKVPTGGLPSGVKPPSGAVLPGGGPGGSSEKSATYKTVQAYFEHLNSVGTRVSYDASTKTAKVLDLGGFVKSQKVPTKDVGAFDGITRQATENTVLGLGKNPLHLAAASKAVLAARAGAYAKLSGWKRTYAATAYTSDFAKTETIGSDVATRLNMYIPMYYISKHYAGYKTSTVATHWRIRTGIMQPDTANTTEINLALALALANLGITSVDFATIWGQAHVMGELTGNSTTNFIAWVKQSVA